MNRRDFLRQAALCGVALATGLGGRLAWGAEDDILRDMLIIDPHAHPDMDPRTWGDQSASYRYMQAVGMAASCYSAVGDRAWRTTGYKGLSNYDITVKTLRWWHDGVIARGNVSLVLNATDIPAANPARPGAILGIEGGDALEGKVERVDEFHRLGVRIITVVHYHNNGIGDIMKPMAGYDPGPYRGGLSMAGHRIIERMQELGMVVDVAHASAPTLKGIVAATRRPLLDSHTGLCRLKPSACGRSRTPEEMEWVAGTGGVVCLWPMGRARPPQKTFDDWAREIKAVKELIGIEHVGIGSDGGGGISHFVDGYHDVRDLGRLATAMAEAGFTRREIALVMGGNVHRVLQQCLS